MTPTYFLILMALFAVVCICGHWLYDGYKQDKKRQERLNAIKNR